MDQFLAMKAFIRVADTGRFAKAADQLNLPRSTVSKLIADLEDHIGAKLIHRTTRTLVVTPEGADYYQRAKRLIDELEDMDNAARELRAQPKGHLRVDIGSSLANRILIPALPDFRRRFPHIEVHLGVSDRPADLIGDGIDCVIRGGVLENTSLIARKICELEYVTCASQGYVDAHGLPLHPADMAKDHELVSYFSSLTGKPFPLIFTRGDEHLEVASNAIIAVNESTAHQTAIQHGLGIGQTFEVMVRPYLGDGTLVRVLQEWTRPAHPLHLLYPPNRHLNARVRVFADWAAGVFENTVGKDRQVH